MSDLKSKLTEMKKGILVVLGMILYLPVVIPFGIFLLFSHGLIMLSDYGLYGWGKVTEKIEQILTRDK